MYQKILVAVDGSKSSEAVLPYARELRNRLSSRLTLISVLPAGSQRGKAQYQHLHQFYIQELGKSSQIETPEVESVIVNGDSAIKISEYAQKKGFHLILMGTHGRSALKRWVLGSISDKLISSVNIPVALVADTEQGKNRSQPKKIFRNSLVFIENLTEGDLYIRYFEPITSSFNMDSTLLHIIEQQYEYLGGTSLSSVPVSNRAMGVLKSKATRSLNKIAHQTNGRNIQTRVEVTTGKHAEVVARVAKEIEADTLFMATRGRSGLSRWFYYGIRDDIVSLGDILVWLIPM